MPDYTVCWIIGRALSDPAYRKLMAQDPEAAWAGYELTAFDLSALKFWTPERILASLDDLEEQIDEATFDGSVGFVMDEPDQATNCDDALSLDDFQKFLGPD